MSGYRGCDLFMQDTCAMSNPLTSVNTRHITADDIRGVDVHHFRHHLQTYLTPCPLFSYFVAMVDLVRSLFSQDFI